MRKIASILTAGFAMAGGFALTLPSMAAAMAAAGHGRAPAVGSLVQHRLSPDGTGLPIASLNAISADGSLAVGADSISTFLNPLTSSGWKQVPSPNPGEGNGSHLCGVASGPHGALWAVGYYYDPNTDIPRGLTLHYVGGSWLRVRSPNPGTRADFFNAVAIGASGDAWAVGGYTGPRCERNLVEHFAAGAWHVLAAPDKGSCPTGTNAFYGVAVYAVGQAGINALAEKHAAGKWTILHAGN